MFRNYSAAKASKQHLHKPSIFLLNRLGVMIALHSLNDVNVQAFTQNQKGLQLVNRLRSKVHAKGG